MERIFSTRVIGRQDLMKLMDLENFEFGRRYCPTDDQAKVTIYHLEVDGWFSKGAVTIEVTERLEREAVAGEYNEYNIQFRIIGQFRNIRRARSRIEELTKCELKDEN